MEEVLGYNQGTIVNVWDRGHCTVIWESDRLKKLGELTLQKLFENKKNLKFIRKVGNEKGKILVAHCKAFSKHAKKATTSEFVEFFDLLWKKYHDVAKHNMIYWHKGGHEIEIQLKEALKSYSEAEIGIIHGIMSKSALPSYSQTEEEVFAELVALAREKGINDLEVSKRIKSFSKKYFWFPYEYVGPGIFTPEAVKARILENLAHPAKETREHIDIKQSQRECIKHYRLSKYVRQLYSILQMITLMQDDRKMYNAMVNYYVNEFVLREVAKRLNTSLENARYFDNDLIHAWANGDKNIVQRLHERTKFLVVTETGHENHYYEGEAGKKILKELGIDLGLQVGDAKEVRGQPAMKGCVKGRARIVLIASMHKDFKEGDILIAGMTTPDFVSLMKKAAAIVTDEGGVTCHAAIVSRELGKPCIIGTKNATRVFKDGDLIEVDADKGIVRKLNP